jgi:hypothetical protein
MTGDGILISSDGERYEGYFQKGVKTGMGRLHQTDGSIYEGEFYNN